MAVPVMKNLTLKMDVGFYQEVVDGTTCSQSGELFWANHSFQLVGACFSRRKLPRHRRVDRCIEGVPIADQLGGVLIRLRVGVGVEYLRAQRA